MIKPIIYQLFPRWFTNKNDHCIPNGTISDNGVGKFNEIDDRILSSLKKLGITHVWYTGIIEHATKSCFKGIEPCNKHIVKGQAGSPYAIRDYYDVSPELANDIECRMKEFEQLVRRTHDAKLKVIIDFVPNHVAREYKSDVRPQSVEDLGQSDDKNKFFDPNNNFYYITNTPFAPNINISDDDNPYIEIPARATGNDCWNASPSVNDWYETVKLNYGVDPWNGVKHFYPIPNTWHKMLEILLFWCSKGIDGFRCDMAHMVPVEFWHWAISQVKLKYASVIFIAEIYDTSLYRSYIYDGGFDYLYDKITLYDTLFNTVRNNQSTQSITACWQTVDDIRNHMLNFLENHDEVRIASQQFAGEPMKALPALVVSATISTCPFMIYAGQELGEKAADAEGFSGHDGKTTIFDYWSIPSIRQWLSKSQLNRRNTLRDFYRRIMLLCNSEKAISNGNMFDLMYVNSHLDRQYVFLRYIDCEVILIVANFIGSDTNISINIPTHALNTIGCMAGTYDAVELINNDKTIIDFQDRNSLNLTVKGHNAVMWKFIVTMKTDK